MVPSQIVALLNDDGFAPARLRSLEMLQSVGAPLHREYKDRLNELLPGRFCELYGLTEGWPAGVQLAALARRVPSARPLRSTKCASSLRMVRSLHLAGSVRFVGVAL